MSVYRHTHLKSQLRIMLILCFACAGALLLSSGCALRHGDYALGGSLRIETSPASGPLFQGIQVTRHADELLVSGYGRRSQPGGHVEISIIDQDGGCLERVRADLLPPRPVLNRGYNYRFRAFMTIVPPAGSTLRAVYMYCTEAAGITSPREYAGQILPDPAPWIVSSGNHGDDSALSVGGNVR